MSESHRPTRNPGRRGLALASALIGAVAIVSWLAWGERQRSDSKSVLPNGRISADSPWAGFGVDSVQEVAPVSPAPIAAADGASGSNTASDSGRLVVRVIWQADGSPAEGIHLRLVKAGQLDPANDIGGVTDAHGLWTLDPAPLGTVGVSSDRDGFVAGEVQAGRATELDLALPPGTLVAGIVLGPEGEPVAHAEIWLSYLTQWARGAIIDRADAEGRFAVRGVSGPRWIGARAPGFTPSDLAEVLRDAPAEMQVELRLGRAGGIVRGTVTDTVHRPIGGASVMIGPDHGWPGPERVSATRGYGPPPFRLRTAADGSFEARDVPPGVVPVEVKASGFTPLMTAIDVFAGETQDHHIPLEPGAVVRGVVRDGRGLGVPGASVSVGAHPRAPGYASVATDAAGHYELRDPPRGDSPFTASKTSIGEDHTKLHIEPGQSLTWDAVLSAGLQIFGRVRDESGQPVEGLHVRCVTFPGFNGKVASAKVAADGTFALPNCEDRSYRLTVHEGGTGPALAALDEVRPSPSEVWIAIPLGARLFATVVLRVVDGFGQPPAGLQCMLVPVGDPFSADADIDAETGSVVFDRIATGDARLHVMAEGRPPLLQTVAGLRAGERRDLGTLVLADPGRIILSLGLPAGVGPADVWTALDAVADHRALLLEPQGDGRTWISPPVPAGEYIVSLGWTSGDESHPFIIPQAKTVRVEAGLDAHVTLVAERGVVQSIELSMAGAHRPKALLKVIDPAGGVVCDEPVSWMEADAGATQRVSYDTFVAKPGAYTLTIEIEGKVIAQQALSLSGAVNIAPAVKLTLP